MCDYKKPFEQVAAQDSRNLASFFNKVGWQGAEDEAKHNVQNPGRAITKASINAALWYLGGEAGGALGSGGGTAADASTNAAESGGTLALNAAGQSVPYAAQGAGQAAAQAAQQAALQYAGGIDPETAAGYGGMGVAQNGIGPGSLLNQARGVVSNPSSLLSSNGPLANLVGGSNTGKAGNLAMEMGLKSLQPQQPQGPPPSRPAGGQQQQPLPTPYPQTNSLLGGQSSVSSSIPPPGMSYAEWIRRKQQMGY